jgi:nitrate reductase gamma subunit
MRHFKPFLFFIVAGVLLVIAEPLLAGNKFVTIGGGVSGISREKIALLKTISGYAGGIIILISLAALLTRRRYEGTILIASKRKKMDASVIVPLVLSVVGLVLIGISFI